MSEPLRATLLIDPASLPAGQTPELADLMAQVRDVLEQVRQKLDADARIAVDGREAAKLCGVSEDTLDEHGAPSIRLGRRKVYRVDSLRAWLAEREHQEAAV